MSQCFIRIGGKLKESECSKFAEKIKEAGLEHNWDSVTRIEGDLDEENLKDPNGYITLYYHGEETLADFHLIIEFCILHELDYDFTYSSDTMICVRYINGEREEQYIKVNSIGIPICYAEDIKEIIDEFASSTKNTFSIEEGIGRHIMSGDDFFDFLKNVGQLIKNIQKRAKIIPPMRKFEIVTK